MDKAKDAVRTGQLLSRRLGWTVFLTRRTIVIPIELCVYGVRLEVTHEMTLSKLDSRIRDHRDSVEFARAFLYNKLSIGRQVDISTRINRRKQLKPNRWLDIWQAS